MLINEVKKVVNEKIRAVEGAGEYIVLVYLRQRSYRVEKDNWVTK